MRNPKAPTWTSFYSSLEAERTDAINDVPICVWEAALNDKRKLSLGKLVTGSTNEANVEHENGPMESCRTNFEDFIAEEVKYAVRCLVQNALLTIDQRVSGRLTMQIYP